jgi:hypothetical protein
MKKIYCLFIILFSIKANAQKLTLENVSDISLRGGGAIRQSDQVKGYYFFYESDKISKKINEYTLQITDEKLKQLKLVKFEDKNDAVLTRSSFNGSDLLFVIHHTDGDKVNYKVFGPDGNAKFEYESEIDMPNMVSNMPQAVVEFMMGEAIGYVYPVEGKGFISRRSLKGGKTFELAFFSSETKKTWTYKPSDGKFISGTYLGNNGNTVFIHEMKLSGMFDRNPDMHLVSIDINTGKTVFDKPTDQAKYKFMPTVSYNINGVPLMYGEYFDLDQSIVKDKSKGMAFWELDAKGNITKEKLISWDQAFSKKFSVNEKGKIEGFGYLFVHDMVRLNDGNVYLVGEGYNVSGNKTSTTDMMLVKFDKNFEVLDMQLFPKQANSVSFDGGGAFMSTQTKGWVMKLENKFDYAYLQKNSRNTAFSVAYSNYVKSGSYKGMTFNSINYNEGKITTDKLNINSDATFTAVLPAQQGQVLLFDFHKKAKRVDVHFEKLN